MAKKMVVVVGGGVAGIAAASELLRTGLFEVVLQEADCRLGGRVQTLKLGDFFVENGAQWVHGNDYNSIFKIANDLKLLDTCGTNLNFDAHSVFVTESGSIVPKHVHKSFKKALMTLTNGPDCKNSDPSSSLGNWAQKQFWEDETVAQLSQDQKGLAAQILDWQQRFMSSIDGCDNWELPSCQGHEEYWECEGNPLNAWLPPAGYSSLVGILLNGKPSLFSEKTLEMEIPSWVQLRKEVVQINYQDEVIQVECSDGSLYSCDHVICTVSLGVLKEKKDTLFSPALPQRKANAIEHLAIGCVDKVHFDFPCKWWPEDIIGFNLLWDLTESPTYNSETVTNEELSKEIDGLPLWCRGIIGFYVVSSHPTALNSWLTGPAARLMETLDEEFVKSTFMKVIRKFLGSTHDIAEPRHFIRSTWFANPYTRGSYSFRSVQSEVQDVWAIDIEEPITRNGKPMICFAGEASHVHFYSTVHGAHDSGMREAKRLTQYVKGEGIDVPSLYPYTEDMFKDSEDAA